MWGRGREGVMVPTPLSTGFQPLPQLPTIKLGPSGAGSRVGGLVQALGPCGSLQWPLLWGWEFLLLPPQSPRVFSLRGLRLYFPPRWSPGLCGLLCSPLFVRFICAQMWGRGVLSTALPAPFSAILNPALSVYGSGCMFLFDLLGVGLPCCSIFCQFWLCEEEQCVYLCRHLGSPMSYFLLHMSIWRSVDISCYWYFIYLFFNFKKILFSYNCLHFLPIPPPHPSQSYLPPPPLPSPLILSLCPL